MFKFIILPFLFTVSAQPAKTQEFSFFIDGHALWNACQSDHPYAYGIVAGIHDALSEAYSKTSDTTLRVCAPANVTIPMIKKTICEDLEKHSNLRTLTAVQVVWSSMLVNYPCP